MNRQSTHDCLGRFHHRLTQLLLGVTMCGVTSAQDVDTQTTQPGSVTARRMAIERANERLQKAWREFGEHNQRGEFQVDPWARRLQPKILSLSRLSDLYAKDAAEFIEPDIIRSKDGKLFATLRVAKSLNKIGADPVFLRNYNGKLVGPTLRCKPGDTLYITLQNDLAPGPFEPGAMNTLHGFNSTNLHTHGLHVSPSGISDNVLLEVGPGSVQKYEIAIPKDHPAGTFWYHAHLHGSTAADVGSGMSGALIIEGGIDTIPEIANAVDRVMVLQQIPYVNNASKATCPEIPPGTDLKVGVIEPEYIDCCFGPRTWDKLGRYTTINGVKLPVIHMRPGAIERWRLVDSSIREVIQPELVLHPNSSKDAPAKLPLYEIAVDGLPLGRVAERNQPLELWPGYRSDVLVQAPNVKGAKYVLRDARTPSGGVVIPEERRYLALVVIDGDPKPMNLPNNDQLAPYRLPSIDPASVTGREVAAYGIIPNANGVSFTVDRSPFSTNEARQISLGEVHEWTVTSRNNVGPVSHPFHIHVNPFEIFSILDPQGVEQLDRDPKTGAILPVWRDTIILNEGWKVSFRTRYTDFDGVFVQHCHILDHEDQGMMELIEISNPNPPAPALTATPPESRRISQPYAAPEWELADATGRRQKLADLVHGPAMLVFFEGFGCLRCNLQMQALISRYASLREKGIQVIGITSDSVTNLGETMKSLDCPFPVLADPEKKAFRSYGCYADGPLHGVFLLNREGAIHWQVVSTKAFMDFETIEREANTSTDAAEPAVKVAEARR